MDDAKLFLEICDDLEQRLQSNKVYDLLKISSLLRQLLLDGTALIHKINRKYRIQIQYVISDDPPPKKPSIIFWNLADGLDPSIGLRPNVKPQQVKLSKLLNTVVIKSRGQYFRISEIIRVCANVMGGCSYRKTRK